MSQRWTEWGDRIGARLEALTLPLRNQRDGYLLAVALMALALLIRLAIAPVEAGLQYVTFFPAVTLAAVAGGARAGLLATVVGMLLATWIFHPPYWSLDIESWLVSFWPNVVFLSDGIIVSFSIEAMHRYRQRYATQLEAAQRVAANEKELNRQLSDLLADYLQAAQVSQKFEAIIQSTDDAIISKTPDGIIQSWNPGAERLFGYTAAEVIGQPMTLLIPVERRGEEAAILARIARREPIEHFETERQHKDGYRINVSVSMSPIFDADGQVVGISKIARDVTAAKQLEQALRRAKAQAEAASQAKSDFLAAMSHEIRTPMNGVIGMLDVLSQTSLQGYQVEMVDLVRESAHSLLDVIEDILDFSKIEAGKLTLEQAPLSVEEVVEKVCALLDHVAQKKRVELMLFVDPAIPARVQGDALRLRQILTNLTGNAIKFSSRPDRVGRVSVRAQWLASRDDGQAWVEFSVRDNGIGMDEATQARLFTPFEQADTSTTRRFGGTGLGLVIARSITEMMGGEISVQSEPEVGSTFRVCLPFPILEPDVGELSDLRGLSCLVIGAGENLTADIDTHLRHAEAKVHRAADIEAAQQMAPKLPEALWVWVLDSEGRASQRDRLRALARAHPQQDIRLLVIGRGKRRLPRRLDHDLVTVDGNLLTRKFILHAVAIAAGREEPAARSESTGLGRSAFIAPSRELACQQGRLVLVAEDNETNQEVIGRQLALLGLASDVASDGVEALQRWQSGDYALLLTDIHMPRMDGYELALIVRAEEARLSAPRTPIIALSANVVQGELQRCLEVGMDDYLSKPVQLDTLKATLEKWLPSSDAPEMGYRLPIVEPVRRDAELAGQSVVEVRILQELVGDDPAVIRDFLQDFKGRAASATAEIVAAIAAERCAEAGALGHKLKSSARSVGALQLGTVCEQIEVAGKASDAIALHRWSRVLASEQEAVQDYLADWLKNTAA